MGKRSDEERKPNDYYPTPLLGLSRAIDIIGKDLPPGQVYAELCAGDGALIRHFVELGFHNPAIAYDIEPPLTAGEGIMTGDGTDPEILEHVKTLTNLIITNPPWSWHMLEPLLDAWLQNNFTVWLLLASDFSENVRSSLFMAHCTDRIPIGRLKWIPGTKQTGKDNCSWYRFTSTMPRHGTRQWPRDRSVLQPDLPDDMLDLLG